ncbi:copper oxidase [Nitrosopumilus sp. b3]|nr:copper oxidase [Nitrosopumilus sp. b3]
MIMTTVILSIALTSVFAFDFENNKFTTTSEIPFAAEAKKSTTHNITIEAVAMPDGLYAYRMVDYELIKDSNDNDDDNEDKKKSNVRNLVDEGVYSTDPTIPGPTIILTEGDEANVTLINNACDETFVDGVDHPLGALPTYSETSMLGIHVHGVQYDISDDATYGRMNMNGDSGALCGEDIQYSWIASPGTSGAWPYHDHTFAINEIGAEELGLFGTVIINPANGKVNGLVDDNSGKIKNVKVKDIEKDFVLWMVSSDVLGQRIFYGNEIDYDTTTYSGDSGVRETALWTNPNLTTVEGGIYRIHVLGLGEETHAFHMHGHRWTEDIHEKASEEDVIDVKEITPLQRHTFLIQASDNDDADTTHDGAEMWMYHCHFVDHMKEGMSGMMAVLPEYESDDIPIIGAVFTLSDEPGLWMKTLNAGIADDLDNYLADTVGVPINARDGTGFSLGYISEALGLAVDPAAETDFTNSEGRSLAVINPGETVLFGMKDSQTKHTITTLIYPTDADRLGGNGILNVADSVLGSDISHFDQQLGIRGSTLLTDKDGVPTGLNTPGLYVFVCKIHPYMFSAVIVDDPNTKLLIGGDSDLPFPLLDLSPSLTVLTRAGNVDPTALDFPTVIPPTHDLAKSLLTTFYVITDPNNWKDYTQPTWNVSLPPVLVTTDSEDVVRALAYDTPTTIFAATELGLTKSDGGTPASVEGFALGGSNIPIPAVSDPSINGVGEVWVDTQFERTVNKNHDGTPADKPGTITVVNTGTWDVERKIALPEINMNHPHNMWTDSKNEVIYQTEWFGNEMAIIDRESGELIKEVFTGQSPSHVMTSPVTDKIYVAINGEDTVNEFDPVTYELTRQISTGFRSHPHGHWISSSGQYIVTPDFLGLKASIIDLNSNTVDRSDSVLYGPIATGMKSDDSVFYTADFLGNSNTALDPSDGSTLGHIDWLAEGAAFGQGLVGLPIQTPISPDDQWMVTALTLGGKIGVVDLTADPGTVTAIFDCDPGCHGVQWGAKDGGGYYAYVSSKFSNALHVVDPNPDNDLGTNDASIVGSIILADRSVDSDDRIIGYDGFGGQGIVTIPNVYDGWIDKTVSECSSVGSCGDVTAYIGQLSSAQKSP